MEESSIIVRTLNLEKDNIETVIDIITASFGTLEKKTGIEEELSIRSITSELVHFLLPIETCIVATLNTEYFCMITFVLIIQKAAKKLL
jgi:hypothetical protein